MKSLILMISLLVASSSHAATQDLEAQNLLTTDVLGYTCVAEEDLDAAFLNQGKGGTVPQTCITEAPIKDCASLTILLGREATYAQCATHAYRYLKWADPDRSTGWGFDCGECVTVSNPPTVATVPLPATWLLLLAALIGLPFFIGLTGLKILEVQDENSQRG